MELIIHSMDEYIKEIFDSQNETENKNEMSTTERYIWRCRGLRR